MRVAVPVDEDKSIICVTFGRAPYFLIHDTESGVDEINPNPAANVQGGAGIKAAQFVIDCRAEALITPRCGQNSADILKEAEINIYKSEGMSVALNLDAFKEKRLKIMENFHAGFQGRR